MADCGPLLALAAAGGTATRERNLGGAAGGKRGADAPAGGAPAALLPPAPRAMSGSAALASSCAARAHSATNATAAATATPTAHAAAAASMADGELEVTVGRMVLDNTGARKTGNRHVVVQDAVTVHASPQDATAFLRPALSRPP